MKSSNDRSKEESEILANFASVLNSRARHQVLFYFLNQGHEIWQMNLKFSHSFIWSCTKVFKNKSCFSLVQSLSCVRLFVTPWNAAHQASLSITNSQSLPKPCPLSQWWHPTTSSSVILFFFCLQSFPASGSSLKSRLFTLGGQRYAE